MIGMELLNHERGDLFNQNVDQVMMIKIVIE